jgi:RNA polymerase sigma factor (sigma-70 family)
VRRKISSAELKVRKVATISSSVGGLEITFALALPATLKAGFAVVSATPINQHIEGSPPTLGDLLYADPRITCVPEKEWVALVRGIAAGQRSALRSLFEKTYPLVFAYLMLCTGDRRMAENLMLDIFEVLWCEAPVFDSASAPVLGWVMRHARVSAIAHASGEEPVRRGSDTIAMTLSDVGQMATSHASGPSDLRLHRALEELTATERASIEAALMHGLSYAEVAELQHQPVSRIKKIISSGLAKLRYQLQETGAGP